VKRLLAATVIGLFVSGALAAALGIINRDGGSRADRATLARQGEGPYRGSEPPSRLELPDFALRNYDGRLVRSWTLREKVVLLAFLDSHCTEPCPVIASHIGRVFDVLTPAERRAVLAVAISTDPGADTAASIRDFLNRYRALGKLQYVGGGESASTLRPIWRRFNVLASIEAGTDAVHSAPLRLYDGGIWATTLRAGVDLTLQNLAHDIRVALRRSRP
jgi:cytochrome oxidase Cu insertion factor (SCO1/SenC/PrrC family)